MEELSREDRILAVASASAARLNTDLTIILSGVESMLVKAPAGPQREMLLEIQKAAERCRETTRNMVNFTARLKSKEKSVSTGDSSTR